MSCAFASDVVAVVDCRVRYSWILYDSLNEIPGNVVVLKITIKWQVDEHTVRYTPFSDAAWFHTTSCQALPANAWNTSMPGTFMIRQCINAQAHASTSASLDTHKYTVYDHMCIYFKTNRFNAMYVYKDICVTCANCTWFTFCPRIQTVPYRRYRTSWLIPILCISQVQVTRCNIHSNLHTDRKVKYDSKFYSIQLFTLLSFWWVDTHLPFHSTLLIARHGSLFRRLGIA